MQIQHTSDVNLINDSIVLIAPEFHLWSGRRAIKPEKLAAMNPNGVTLPPSALASLGSVKLVDPEELKVFERIKDDTNRLLASKGLKLFGGYAINADDFESVRAALLGLQDKFENARAQLLVTLDPKITQWVTTWVSQNPDYQYLLQNLPTAANVCDRMSFDFHAFRINPPQDGDSEAASDYRTKLQGLRGELYREAAKEAQVLMSEYLVTKEGSNRDYITQKTLRPVKRIAERLRQFTFVDPAAGPLADVIDWTMQQVPCEGRVDGAALMAVWSMARLLANPEEAARVGQLSIQSGPEAAWNLFAQETTAATATVQAEQPQQVDAVKDLDNFADALDSFKAIHAQAIQQAEKQDQAPSISAPEAEIVVPDVAPQLHTDVALDAMPTSTQHAPKPFDLGILF